MDLRRHGLSGENYYARTDGGNAPYHCALPGSLDALLARATIAAMLERVNGSLAASGLELFVWDAYRPVACQRGLWDFFWAKARAQKPGASDADLLAEVQSYVSDPSGFDPADSATWPTHATGGAIDLTLRDLGDGTLLPMGAEFDEMGPAAHTDHFERQLAEGAIAADDPRLLARRRLYWAMVDAGFSNYAYEFWHFDFGNQMHVMSQRQSGAPAPAAAWYGFMPLDGET